MLKPEQCRGARGVLGWSQLKLSQEASVSLKTIQNFEHGKHAANNATIAMLKAALERAGISFEGGVITGGKQANLLAQSTQNDSVGNWYSATEKQAMSNEQSAELRKQIRDELRIEVLDEVSASTRVEVEDELRPLITSQVKDEVRESLRNELREEITRDLEPKIRNEVTASLPTKETLRTEVRNEVREELRVVVQKEESERIRSEVEAEWKAKTAAAEPVEKFREKLLIELRGGVEQEIRAELEKNWTGERAQLEKDLRFGLRAEIDRELRQVLRDEMWSQAYAQGKREAEAQAAQSRSHPSVGSYSAAQLKEIVRVHIDRAVKDLSSAIVARAGDKLGMLVPTSSVEQLIDGAVRDEHHRIEQTAKQAGDEIGRALSGDQRKAA